MAAKKGSGGPKRKIVVRKPSPQEIEKLGCRSWEIWTCEAKTFPWRYDERETCYILEGRVRVEGKGEDEGLVAEFGPGDLVVFPEGLECTWVVKEPVRKHYKFG